MDAPTLSGVLCESARQSNLSQLTLYLQCGADVNTCDYDNRSARLPPRNSRPCLWSMQGHVLPPLAPRPALSGRCVIPFRGRTALHLAASEGNRAVTELLLKATDVNINPKDRWGGTPLRDGESRVAISNSDPSDPT